MTRLMLDGSTMQSESDFHDQVSAHPETPEHYGRNLDALFDILVSEYRSPVLIVWDNAQQAREELGKRYSLILDTFGDAEEELRMAGRRLGVLLR